MEVYHDEGKDQLQDFNAIQRHIALVAVVYSLLRASQRDPNLRERLQRQLFDPRAIFGATLEAFGTRYV